MPVENPEEKSSVPEGLWTKCPGCEEIIYNKELDESLRVCPKCGHYFRLSARERIAQLTEPNSFRETDASLTSADPLRFADMSPYPEKLQAAREKTGLAEAVITGEGKIGPHRAALAVLDFGFLGGSMGSVVGEKVTRTAELALEKRVALVTVTASGGARMQEGILSLMQMAKVNAALARLASARIPFISVLGDPTTGGVTASFAMAGDVIVAEPGALIGFAGPRVIEQTIKQNLPEGFQRSEFLLQHGQVDLVCERKEIKDTLIRLLSWLSV